jgi:20S proteasome alpha/beta subunit
VKRGALSVGLTGKDCVILAAERKAVPKLQDSRTIKKLNKIDKHVFMSFAGLIADSRSLLDYARLECQSYRYALDTSPSVEYVAKQIAIRQQE